MISADQFTPQYSSRFWSRILTWVFLVVSVLASAVLISTTKIEIALPVIALPFVVGLAFINYRLTFLGFIFVLFAFWDTLGYSPLLTSPVKLYVADGMLLLMAALA